MTIFSNVKLKSLFSFRKIDILIFTNYCKVRFMECCCGCKKTETKKTVKKIAKKKK